MRSIFNFLAVIVSITLSTQTGMAQAVEYGNNVVISAPVHQDLYVSGGTVTINAPVYGDVVVAGGTVIINDTITNDLIVAAGTIKCLGYIGDDIRCGGGELTVTNYVAGDLLAGGGKISIERNAIINGGVLAGGGEVRLDGLVNGNVRMGSGTYLQNGTVNGNLESHGNTATINGTVKGKSVLAANKLVIGNAAAFYNDVRFWSETKNIDFKNALHGASAVYDPKLEVESERWHYLGQATFLGLIWYIGAAFLFIVLLQYLFGDKFRYAADIIYNRTWQSLGYGLLFFVGVPIAAVIVMVTIIGIPVGLLLVIAYVVLVILASVITSLTIAHWLNNWRAQAKWSRWWIIWTATCVFVVVKLLSTIPVLGWLFMFVAASIAFGGLLMNIHRSSKQVA